MLAMRDYIQLKHMFNSRPFFVMSRVLHICFYSIDEGIPTSTDQSRFDSLQEQQTNEWVQRLYTNDLQFEIPPALWSN